MGILKRGAAASLAALLASCANIPPEPESQPKTYPPATLDEAANALKGAGYAITCDEKGRRVIQTPEKKTITMPPTSHDGPCPTGK